MEGALPVSPRRQVVVMGRKLSKMSPSKTSMIRRTLLPQPRATRSDALDDDTKALVNRFYISDKISRTLPGRKDVKSVKLPNGKREKRQKMLLMYSTADSNDLFKEEYPDIKIGLTKFRELRPEHVVLMTTNDQIVCACKQCENTQLIFNAIKGTSVLPLDYSSLHQLLKATVCRLNNESCCLRECAECGVDQVFAKFEEVEDRDVTVDQWAPDPSMNNYLNKIPSSLPLAEAISILKEKVNKLGRHEYGKNRQLSEISYLKEHMKNSHIVMQADFSENFSCKQPVEIQSAYFSTINVTLYTAVVWYRDGETVISKSYVVVSDDLAHDKRSVYAFNKVIIDNLKENGIPINHIHYFTDGPSSQFKNRYTVQNLVEHQKELGSSADWSFFEAGHGKGPVDGIGGTVKRKVLISVYRGQHSVYNCKTFYDTAAALFPSTIKILLVGNSQIVDLSRWENAPEVKGISKCHYITINDKQAPLLCAYSPFCPEERTEKTPNNNIGEAADMPANDTERLVIARPPFMVGSVVGVAYEDNMHIGEIVTDDKDGHKTVKFMVRTTDLKVFKWPASPECTAVHTNFILDSVPELVPTSASRHSMFRLGNEKDMYNAYNEYCKKYF